MAGFYKRYFFFIILLITLLLFSTGHVLAQAPAISYQTPQTYTINTTITPLNVNNKGGTVPAETYGNVTTFAGNGQYSFINGVGAAASFRGPVFLTFDAQGNLYVADPGNNMIRKIAPDATVTTFAGTGSQGSNNGNLTAATFNYPVGVATDAQGNIFVADQNNNLIRKITPAGVVSTFAGNGSQGKSNGAGSSASFNSPFGMAFDSKGNMYVADGGNNLIRKITPAGVVSTFAGSGSKGKTNSTGTAASFNNPTDVTADSKDDIFVADHDNNLIREITPGGVVTTFAGGGPVGIGNATTTTVNLGQPYCMRIDKQGLMYVVAEFENQIKIINPDGTTRDLAGSGNEGYADGIGTSAMFFVPVAIALDTHNNLFVSDNQNIRIRKIALTGYTIDKTLPAGLVFNYSNGTISGTPTVLSPPTDYTVTAYNSYGSSSTVVNIQVDGITPLSMQPFGNVTTCDLNFNTVVSGGTGSYTYSSSNPSVATINATTGSITIVGAGTSTISVTDGAADKAEQLLTVIKVNTSPAISVTPDFFSSCHSLSVTYTATVTNTSGGYINYQWQVNGQNAGTNSSQFTSTSLQTGDKITCTLQGNACYSPVTSNVATIETDPMITPGISIASSAKGTVSYNTAITFTANITNGGIAPNLLWFLNGAATGVTTPTYTSSCLNDGDVITCTLNLSSGKCYTSLSATSNPIKVSITGSLNQSVAISASSTNILQGTPVTFTATIQNGGGSMQYQWEINGVPAGTNSAVFTSSTLDNDDVVSCTVYENSGCINSIISKPITITVYTALVLSPITDKTTCDVDFTPSTSGGTLPYNYTSSNHDVAVISGSYIHITGTGKTQITATDQNNQQISQTLIVTEAPTPIITIGADNTSVCAATAVNFTATISNPDAIPVYQWQINGNNAGTNSPQFTTSSLSSTDVVQCIAYTPCSAQGYSNKLSVNVIQYTTPSITIAQSSSSPVAGGTLLTFRAVTTYQSGSASYQWEINGKNAGANDYQFSSSSLKNGDIVTCKLTTDNMCILPVTSNAITISGLTPPNIFIPNAFTPNGDGINDQWNIAGLNSYYPGCKVCVYNRYGALVYQSIGYGKAWDGTFKGNALSSGTYYYIINLDNTSPALSGPLTILR